MPRRCELDDCDNPYRARGMCNKHYLRWKNAGGRPDARPHLWTPEDDTVLLAAGITPWTERYVKGGRLAAVAAQMGRSEQACCDRLNRLMKQAGHEGGQWTDEGLWTPEEDDVIRVEMAKGIGNAIWITVGAMLGRTNRACAVRAYNLRKQERLAS